MVENAMVELVSFARLVGRFYVADLVGKDEEETGDEVLVSIEDNMLVFSVGEYTFSVPVDDMRHIVGIAAG